MAGEDSAYLRWLAYRRCIAPGCNQRSGPPHHPRHGVAMSRRAHDHRAVPLCPCCHEDAQQYRGVWSAMGKIGMRAYFDDAATELRNLYLKIEENQ